MEMSKKTCVCSLASVLPLAHRTVAGQLEGHTLVHALLVTLGSAAATAASAAERTNAKRAMIEVQLLERRERAAKKKVSSSILVCHSTLAHFCATATKKVFRSAWATARRRNI